MEKFPSYVTCYRIIKKGLTNEHLFCAMCGKEITHFDFKTGNLYQRQHFLCNTESGIQIRLCWRRDNCLKRKQQEVS